MADYRDTLILPFTNGDLSLPEHGQSWRFLNAQPIENASFIGELKCEQRFRVDYLALEKMGVDVEPLRTDIADCDGVLVLATRTRKENERNIIRAWNGLKKGGVLVFAGDKTSGVQPLRKWIKSQTPIAGSLSKHHGVVFWAYRNGKDWPMPDNTVHTEDYNLEPGMFSANGIDKGSRLLVEHFGHRIFGRVADFGAGWGYLSRELQLRCDRMECLDLYEADWISLRAANQHLGDAAHYHWVDLMREAPKGPFNWIIMNPPFHTGRAAEPGLGQVFIKQAAKALPSGGRLLMVANNNLPYEAVLASQFKRFEFREKSQGFKVIEAVKG